MEQLNQFLNLYIAPALTIFGVTGNIMIIYIYSNARFSRQPLRSFHIALAIFDSVSVLDLLFKFILEKWGFDIYPENGKSCVGIYILSFLAPSIARSILNYINIERAIKVWCPSFVIIKKLSYQCFIIVLIITVNSLLYIPLFVFNDNEKP